MVVCGIVAYFFAVLPAKQKVVSTYDNIARIGCSRELKVPIMAAVDSTKFIRLVELQLSLLTLVLSFSHVPTLLVMVLSSVIRRLLHRRGTVGLLIMVVVPELLSNGAIT